MRCLNLLEPLKELQGFQRQSVMSIPVQLGHQRLLTREVLDALQDVTLTHLHDYLLPLFNQSKAPL